MEHLDSGDAVVRSALTIDLNETPFFTPPPLSLESSALDVVRFFHGNKKPATGTAASLPEEGEGLLCGACGRPEVRGHVVICDGCERGFHLTCAGMRGKQAVNLVEWICGTCLSGGIKSKLWPVGVKCKQVLDINASPPSDVDVYNNKKDVFDWRMPISEERSAGKLFNPTNQNSNLFLTARNDGMKHASGVIQSACDVGSEMLNLGGSLQNNLCVPGLDKYDNKGSSSSSSSNDDNNNNKAKEMFISISEKYGAWEQDLHVESKQLCGGLNVHAEGLLLNGSYSESSIGERDECVDAEMEEEKACNNLHLHEVGLPLQLGNFFLLLLGKVDARPSYHDGSNIWPVGFKSCWHDKVTGSLFMFQVLDGGDSGPIFKLSRSSCSASFIPAASTVLCGANLGRVVAECHNTSDHGICCYNLDCENYGDFELILADPSPPTEGDILSCLSLDATGAVQASGGSSRGSSLPPVPGDLFLRNLGLGDEIGGIEVEEESLSSAWSMMSEKLVSSCLEIFKRRGAFEFSCNHFDDENGLSHCGTVVGRCNIDLSLAKFFDFPPSSASVPLNSQSEHDALGSVLVKWLDQDRSGLGADFVREIIEKLPGAKHCSKYECLADRPNYLASLTAGSGLLVAKRKNGADMDGSSGKSKKPRFADECFSDDQHPAPHVPTPPPFPLGRPICCRLHPPVVGDFYQVWECFWRFHEILGLEVPFLLEELEEELINPLPDLKVFQNHSTVLNGSQVGYYQKPDAVDGHFTSSCERPSMTFSGDAADASEQEEARLMAGGSHSRLSLANALNSLLGLLITELHAKAAQLADPNFECGESKAKRGRRKDMENWNPARANVCMLPVNALTWPEVARRYILAVLSVGGNFDSVETAARESGKVFQLLQGDGGVLCGSLGGVAGMEADAHLLAGAREKIFGSLQGRNDVLTLEYSMTDASGACEKNDEDDGIIPEWAQMLEPVRKLPTNVGTRIRRCVYDALEKCPPEWARKRLVFSISKEVYKGNASGPTKKAVISVLAEVLKEDASQKYEKRKEKIVVPVLDIIMKRCRIMLRHAAAADEEKVFCTLLGRILTNSLDIDDEGLLGSPAMVSRPLDFRTIDLRLAAGAYGGSHESFIDDVRELWDNIRTTFQGQHDFLELVETLAQNFEILYEREVVILVQKFEEYARMGCLDADGKREIDDIIASVNAIPRAPWDEGICKVCGVDKDDDSVLLCDTCDAEYHTYCLTPPLAAIPNGNWYCPSCAGSSCMLPDVLENARHVNDHDRCEKHRRELAEAYMEKVRCSAVALQEKEYWRCSLEERISLVKFLCDEFLGTFFVRQHLERCIDAMADSQQNLRSFLSELKTLKSREECLASRAAKMEAKANPSRSMEQAQNAAGEYYLVHAGSSSVARDMCAAEQMDEMCEVIDDADLSPSENGGSCRPKHGCQSISAAATSELETCHVELSSARNDILHLQNSIASIESKLTKLCLRREFLGTDSRGCLYWGASALPGNQPRIVVDGSPTMQSGSHGRNGRGSLEDGSVGLGSKPPWFAYESESEVDALLSWLRDCNQNERELKASIFQWKKVRFQKSQYVVQEEHQSASMIMPSNADVSCCSSGLSTRAAMSLEKKYNSSGGGGGGERMYRCGCLEPVFSSRHHCSFCHKSFGDDNDVFWGHNKDQCGPREVNVKDIGRECFSRGQVKLDEVETAAAAPPPPKLLDPDSMSAGFPTEEALCGSDFKQICSTFMTKDSNRELVQEIGLLGSNGIPSLVACISPCLEDSGALMLISHDDVLGGKSCVCDDSQGNQDETSVGIQCGLGDSFHRAAAAECAGRMVDNCKPLLGCLHQGELSQIMPKFATKPVVGKLSQIMRQLKINLLDMEAAVPEEAIRPSREKLCARLAWREHVKHAQSIYEMVQAVIVLEEMIKKEYLLKERWYWSSLSAAAKTQTVSALALRIYALDSALVYDKLAVDSASASNCGGPATSHKPLPLNLISTDPMDVDRCRGIRKSSRKRKETEV